MFLCTECILRDRREHIYRCAFIESALIKRAQVYWSQMYGINTKSLLLEVPQFCLTKCLLFDPMHVLFKGITASEMKITVLYLINEKHYFTASQFIESVNKISASLTTSQQPNSIDIKELESEEKFKQTAHQM